MGTLGIISIFVLALVIWFKTEAFTEYSRLLRLPWAKVPEYYLVKSEDRSCKYIQFLKEYYGNYFVVRLITCPICIGIVLGILASPALIYFLGWYSPSIIVCFGLLLFYTLSILIDKYA